MRSWAPFTDAYDSIYFNWLIFGHAGKVERDGNSILLSQTMRAAKIDVHTKTITRTSRIDPVKVPSRFGERCPRLLAFLGAV